MVVCPQCGNFANVSNTHYGVRHDCCGLHSWGGKPLRSAETHLARRQAHEAFDPLWKVHKMSRNVAYKLLAEKLNMTKTQCHMSYMDDATARRVPAAVKEILTDLQTTEATR